MTALTRDTLPYADQLFSGKFGGQSLLLSAGTIDWRTSTLAGDEYQTGKRETQVDKKEPAAEDSGSEQPSRPLMPEGTR